MPGEEGGPPPSQDFRLVGRRRAGSPFLLGFEKIPLRRTKEGYPRNLHYPIKRLLRRLAAEANAPPGQASAARALRSAEAAPLPGFQGRSPWGCAGWGSAIEVDEEEAA